MLRLIVAVLIPVSSLSFLLLSGKFISNTFSNSIGNLVETLFGVLLFWPIALYQRLMPEPKASWEGFWNSSMAPCAILMIILYIIVVYILLGKTRFFSRSRHLHDSDCQQFLTCSVCGKTFRRENCDVKYCPDCQGELR